MPPAFTAFLQELWPDARAKGVTRATFDLAFAGVTPDPRIMPITQRQPEFGQSVGTYIANFASKSRIETGMRKAAEHAATLEAVEKRYGVDRWLVLAIWGVETNYGGMRDRWDVIRSLATLAQARWRHPFFRDELITALLILQESHIAPRRHARLVGRRDGPAAVHAFELHGASRSISPATAGATSGPACPTCSPRSPTTSARKAGSPAGAKASRSTVPPGFDLRQSRGTFDDWRLLGVHRVDGSATCDRAMPSCSSQAARAALPS